jgi:SAM-dependent methyltransferase
MTSPRQEQLPGHEWLEAERVAEYVERMDRQQEERMVIFSLLTRLVPFAADAEIHILDIGSGYGPLAAALLDAYPNARAVGLDISDAMMEVGRERMARFGDRFSYVVGDFADGHLPDAAVSRGPYHVAVSSRAIHHLPPDGMRSLYADICSNLRDGGCFFNVDTASPPDDFLHDAFRSARRRDPAAVRGAPAQGAAARGRTHAQTAFHHREATLERHLAWLKEAGFGSVECFWKRLDQAMVGGYKR